MMEVFFSKQVKEATQQKYIHRMKRDGIPTDPKFGEMWYLVSTDLRNSYWVCRNCIQI